MRKRIISFLLAAALLVPSPAFALKPTGPLTGGGAGGSETETETETESTWFKQYRAEVRVKRILQDNIAFVANSDKIWLKDRQTTISKKCYMDEYYNFYIPAEAASELFDVSISGDYIKCDELKQKAGLTMYFDPLGLVLFSKNAASIPARVDWYTVCDAMGEIQWEYVDFTEEEREALVRKWQRLMSIPENAQKDHEAYFKSSVTASDTAREKLAYDGAKGPFSDLDIWSYEMNTPTYLANLSSCYGRLQTMSRAYFLGNRKDTALRDDILKALEFLYDRHYSKEQAAISKAWTNEQMTIPYAYANILCFMYDDMTQEDRVRHTNAVFDRHPDPTMRRGSSLPEVYTNRSWRCYSFFNVAVMAGDVERMNYAMKYINQAFMYTLTGFENKDYDTNGFYEDGSMIFHNGHAYNLGYGQNYLMAHSVQLLLTEGTRFDIRNLPNWKNIYEFITVHMLPFVQDNSNMRMVTGRNSPGTSSNVVTHMCLIMNYAPEPYKTKIAKAIRSAVADYWTTYENMTKISDHFCASGATIIMELKKAVEFINSLEEAQTKEKYSKIYYNMDRVVHRAQNFTAALAMSSQRIYKLEAYGAEKNGHGWYTGDGMLYIYNGDGRQHNARYKSESNPYHMPGTTVDSTKRTVDWHTSEEINWGRPDNLWAGGVTNGTSSMSVYEIGNKYVSNLKGKKSYFMLDDKVVCMGSGISGGNGNVYTTVENFMLDKKGEAKSMTDLKIPIQSMTTSEESGMVYTSHETFDGDISTSAATDVLGAWYCYDMGEVTEVSGIAMAFPSGAIRQEIFRIEVSDDNVNFREVYNGQGNGKTTQPQYFSIPFKARYVKLICLQNNLTTWFNLGEISMIKGGVETDYVKEIMSTITTGYEDFYMDGEKTEVEFNKPASYSNPTYAWLEGAGGYVFPDGGDITFCRETYDTSVQPFAGILLNHGTVPRNETYSYVLLPKATMEETQSYAKEPSVEILSNTSALHLLHDKESGLWAASVFAVGNVMDINVKTPCVMLKDTKKKTIYVSDPTHRFDEIKLVLPKGMKAKPQDGITVNGQEVIVDISARKGATYSFGYTE